MSSELRVNKLTSRSGVGTVTFNDSGLIITGIATAATLDITGNATIAGVLSYDDVTNVDSVGIITARSGLRVVGTASSIGVGVANPAEKIDVAGSIQSDTGLKVAGHPVVGYGNLGGGEYAARLGSTGSSTLNKTQIYARGAHVATFDGASGRMGLGASSPGKLLDLQAASGLAIRYYNGSTFRAGLEVATNAGDMVATSSAGDFCIRSQSNLLVSAGGDTERLRIKSDGDVYIGNIAHSNEGGANSSYRTLTLTDTTNGAQLHLRGQSPKLFLDVTSGGNGEIYYDSGDLRILSGEPGTTSSEKLRINSSGVVTIGTTAAGSNAKFEVASTTGSISSATARINGGSTTTGAINTGASLLFAGHDGVNGRDFASLFAGKENGTSGNHAAYLAFGTRVNGGSTTEKMRIDSSGRMGLGTASPKRHLHIHGGNETVKIQITNTTTGSNTDGDGFQIAIAANGDAYLEQRENLPLIFSTNNTERMRIDSSGKVIIGTNTAATNQKLTIRATEPEMALYATPGSSSILNMGDTDNYQIGRILYQNGDNSMRFYTNVSERMRINSSGRMGLGTGSPTAKLHLFETAAGNADFGAINLTNYDYGGGETGQSVTIRGLVRNSGGGQSETGAITFGKDSDYSDAANRDGNIQFFTNSSNSFTEKMRIDSAGRLGLGTVSATQLLEMHGDTPVLQMRDTSSYVAGTGPEIRFQGLDSNGLNKNFASILGISHASNDGQLIFKTRTGGSQYERVRIDELGRVLIGTTTEGHPNADNLTVSDSGDCGITIRSGTTSNGRIYFSDGTSGGAEYNGAVDYDHANNSLAFFTTGGQRMRIDSLGGVYIGASSDYNDSNYSQTSGSGNFYYKKDSGSAGGTIIASNNADRGWSLAYFNKFAYNSGDDNRFIAWYVNGTSQATINWNGSSVVYAGNSDYRLKTNASDYAGGIDKVKQLQVREYEWIDNPNAGRCVGFYAHELQEIFPEAVTGVKDGMKIDEFTEERVPEYQGIDYGKITPLLTKALQEAIAKIETLEAKVAALEG